MNNTEIELIKECILKKLQISIERDEIEDELLSAIPVAIGGEHLIVQYIYDFNFDGFKLLCLDDISEIRRGPIEEFHDKILESEDVIVDESFIKGLKINSWYDFILSLYNTGKMIDISLEKIDKGQTFFIGKIVTVQKKYLELLEIDVLGKWHEETKRIAYDDISLISVSNRYCEILDKYCQQETTEE